MRRRTIPPAVSTGNTRSAITRRSAGPDTGSAGRRPGSAFPQPHDLRLALRDASALNLVGPDARLRAAVGERGAAERIHLDIGLSGPKRRDPRFGGLAPDSG